MFSWSSQKMNTVHNNTWWTFLKKCGTKWEQQHHCIALLFSLSLSLPPSLKDRAHTTQHECRVQIWLCVHIAQFLFVCAHCTIPFCVCKHKYIQHGCHGYGGKQIISPSNYDEEKQTLIVSHFNWIELNFNQREFSNFCTYMKFEWM